MVVISQDVVLRRLQDIQAPTQEAIETMSMWIMHYKDKASIDVIVDGWLSAFRLAGSDQQRTALFYVMNDVVQKAKNKHIDTLIPAFQPAVLTAVGIGKRYDKVKLAMRRCIEIFGERQVFAPASVNAMKNILDVDDTPEGEESALDIDTDEIHKKIDFFIQGRSLLEDIMKNVLEGDFNYRAKIKHSMRDRNEGKEVVDEVKRAIKTMIDVRHAMELQKKKMMELVETAELAKRVYSHQLREVTIVEDAYQKFGQGIRDVRTELMEMERTGAYPGLTPPRDAPSPTANDDIYATGVESVLNSLRVPGSRDNREIADMEIGDDDEEDIPTTSYSQAAKSLRGPTFVPQMAVPKQETPQESLQSRAVALGLMMTKDGKRIPPVAEKKPDVKAISTTPTTITTQAPPQRGTVPVPSPIPPANILMPPTNFSLPPPGFSANIPPPLFSAPPPMHVPPPVIPNPTPTSIPFDPLSQPLPPHLLPSPKPQVIPQQPILQPPPAQLQQSTASPAVNKSGITISRSQHADLQAILKNLQQSKPETKPLDVQIPSHSQNLGSGPNSHVSSSSQQQYSYRGADQQQNPSHYAAPYQNQPPGHYMQRMSSHDGEQVNVASSHGDVDDRLQAPAFHHQNQEQTLQYGHEEQESEDQQSHSYGDYQQRSSYGNHQGYGGQQERDRGRYEGGYRDRGGYRGQGGGGGYRNRDDNWNSDRRDRDYGNRGGGYRGGRGYRGGGGRGGNWQNRGRY